MYNFYLILAKFFQKLALGSIKMYQKTISPDHGFLRGLFPGLGCRFYPSCSQYTQQAIDKFGLILGVFYGIQRIFRCNPWSHGGFDPINH